MIKLKNISKSYFTDDSKKRILDDITISFPKKGFFSILGKSGSGKSTLLNIIGSLEKCDSGYIEIDNNIVDKDNERYWDFYRYNYIGFVFQEYNLLEELSVEDNISLALEIAKSEQVYIKEKVNFVLEQVDLVGFNDRKISNLSGGEKQRVAIARTLIKDSLVILADEPTGNLDEKMSIKILELLKKISEDRLVIMVTHDKEFAEKYSDITLLLKNGQIVGEKDIYEHEINSKAKSEKIVILEKKISFKYKNKLSKNNLAYKKKRLRLLILSVVMSFFLISLSYTFFNFEYGKVTDRSFKKNNIEEIMFEYELSSDLDDYSNVYQDYLNLAEEYPESNTSYVINNAISLSSLGNYIEYPEEEDLLNWYIPHINGFVVHNGSNLELEYGDFETGNNNIVITDYLANMLIVYSVIDVDNIEDLINESIPYTIDSVEREFIITGIVNTSYEEFLTIDDETGNYLVEEENLPKFRSIAEDQYLYLFLSKNTYENFIEETFTCSIVFKSTDDSFFFYNLADAGVLASENIIGELPENSNEIIISLSHILDIEDITLNEYLIGQDIYNNSWIGRSVELKSVSSIDFDLEASYTIIGIFDDVNENSSFTTRNGMYVLSEVFDTFFEKYQSFFEKGLLVQIDKDLNNADLYNDLYNKGYQHDTYMSYVLIDLNGTVVNLRYIIIGLFTFILIYVSIIIHSYFSNTMDNRHKQLGVLKTLGLSNKECGKIYIWETTLVLGISFILAIPVNFVFNFIIQLIINQISVYPIMIFHFDMINILVVIFCVSLLSYISTVLSVRSIFKCNIIDVIRS